MARLSWRSPPRLSRCRVLSPEDASIGATPARRAKAASLWNRPGWNQVTMSRAAVTWEMPGLVEELGCGDLVEGTDVVLEVGDLVVEVSDPAGDRGQGDLVGGVGAGGAQPGTPVDERAAGEASEVVAEFDGSCHHDTTRDRSSLMAATRARCAPSRATPYAAQGLGFGAGAGLSVAAAAKGLTSGAEPRRGCRSWRGLCGSRPLGGRIRSPTRLGLRGARRRRRRSCLLPRWTRPSIRGRRGRQPSRPVPRIPRQLVANSATSVTPPAVCGDDRGGDVIAVGVDAHDVIDVFCQHGVSALLGSGAGSAPVWREPDAAGL